MRTLVIGDIHGGLLALEQVFERAKITSGDRLIFLGDYVDGWSQSPQVLEFLIDLRQTQDCILLRGNHDALLLDWLKGTENKLWYQHGGLATIEAYSLLSEAIKIKHIPFLESLENYFIDDENCLFVHAGFTNLHGVTQEFFPRNLYWERTLWETALALDPRIDMNSPYYPARFKIYSEIFIGHTPVTRLGETVPINRANVWNVDTGAAFKGKLTVMDVQSKQYWQSDSLPELYPNEKGRN